MSQTVEMHIIARIRSDFPTKFGIPRQSGLADVPARIVFEPEYRNADALRGIEGFSHLWLIWQFSAAVREGWSPTVRPPKLGGNKRIGVFATRSPFRPNEIGKYKQLLDHLIKLALKRQRREEEIVYSFDSNVLAQAGSFGAKGCHGQGAKFAA